MSRKPSKPEGQNASTEANDAATPMGKFEELTRRLLKVTPEQLREEQRRFESGKGRRK